MLSLLILKPLKSNLRPFLPLLLPSFLPALASRPFGLRALIRVQAQVGIYYRS